MIVLNLSYVGNRRMLVYLNYGEALIRFERRLPKIDLTIAMWACQRDLVKVYGNVLFLIIQYLCWTLTNVLSTLKLYDISLAGFASVITCKRGNDCVQFGLTSDETKTKN
jgi:hypothetical protein